MQTIKQLQFELSETESIGEVSDALGEIAIQRLKQTQANIVRTRSFFQDLAKVYHTVKLIAARRIFAARQSAEQNTRTISLLLTSNRILYGELDRQLSGFFIQRTAQYQGDLLVVGKSGEKYLRLLGFNRPFNNFIAEHEVPSVKDLLQLTRMIKTYGKVFVYHPKFVTVLQQGLNVSDLTESTAAVEALTSTANYILEPDIDKMLAFFEGQLLTAFLQSVFLEADLAKTAARIISMDSAKATAQKVVQQKRRALVRAKRALDDTEQREDFVRTMNTRQEFIYSY